MFCAKNSKVNSEKFTQNFHATTFPKTGAVRVKNSVTRAGYDVEIARNRVSEVVSAVLHALIVLHVHREIVARSPGSMTR